LAEATGARVLWLAEPSCHRAANVRHFLPGLLQMAPKAEKEWEGEEGEKRTRDPGDASVCRLSPEQELHTSGKISNQIQALSGRKYKPKIRLHVLLHKPGRTCRSD